MARPDPALLDPARYPHVREVDPRFGDLDVNLHVNNVALSGILEDARVRFHRETGYKDTLQGLSSMVASIQIDYLGQLYYPDSLTVHTALEGWGRTSHRVAQLVTQGERLCVFARAVIVTVGAEGPAPMPESLIESFGQWTLRP